MTTTGMHPSSLWSNKVSVILTWQKRTIADRDLNKLTDRCMSNANG